MDEQRDFDFFMQTFCFSGDVAVDGCRMERLAGLAPVVELLLQLDRMELACVRCMLFCV